MKYELKYDQPTEVTEKQYNEARKRFGGIIAHRKDEETGKYYIKLWLTKYRALVQECLIQNEEK